MIEYGTETFFEKLNSDLFRILSIYHGYIHKKKKKLNKTEVASNDQTPPSTTEEMCGAAPRAKSPHQLSKSASKTTAASSKISVASTSQSIAPPNKNTSKYSSPSLLPKTEECSEVLETIVESVDLQSTPSRDPDLVPPFYVESPPKPPSKSAVQQSPRTSMISRPVDAAKSAVRTDYLRSESPLPSGNPVQSTRSGSATRYEPKSPKPESPVEGPVPRSRSPMKCRSDCAARSPRSESPMKCPVKSSGCESPVKCPAESSRCGRNCLGKSPRSESPVKLPQSESPANTKNAVWPTKAGVPRKGGNVDAVFCSREKAFGTSLIDDASSCASAPGGPDYARSEETLLSATEKSHNGYKSGNTSRTTMMGACDDDDDNHDDSSCECECACEPPICQVTKQETKTTKQQIRRDCPPCTSVNSAQRCFSGDGNHFLNGCNCDVRLNQNLTCYAPPRVVPNIPQLSLGYAIPCVKPMIGIPCHATTCDSENGGGR
nr:unnamed protein product [Callosobruchus chinensis]